MFDQHPSIADTYSLVVATAGGAGSDNSNNSGTSTGKMDNDTEAQMRSKGHRQQQQQQQQHQGRRLCTGCLQEISEIHDRFVLRVSPDLEFHAGCLKCSQCECYLDETCIAYIRDNKPYCKEDYIRITDAKRCVRCKEYISRSDMVIRARALTYHAACFSCSSCDKKLQMGEEYVLREREDDVLCRADCDNSIEQPSSIKTDIYGREEEDGWDGSTLTSLDNQMSNTPPLSLRSPKSDEVIMTFNNSKSQVKKNKKDKQSTRVRTVLNERQLTTLKACYAANARPDAMMKEHLVEMTGLSPRVIRVWFQNKRCKDKKRQIAMKHLQQKAETERAITGVRMNGVGPLIAASPTPHNDPMVGIQPVDIHQFPQNSGMWSGMEPMDAQGGLPPAQHVPLPPTIQQPSPFAQMMLPPPHYADLGNDLSGGGGGGGYGAMVPGTGPSNHHFPPVNMGTDLEFSPQVNASDLSSPSCSE